MIARRAVARHPTTGVVPRALGLAAGIALFCHSAGSQPTSRPSPAAVGPIDTLFADSVAAAQFARDSVGSFTVGIVAGDRLVWTRTYGYADMAAHRPATRHTVYRIGSITRAFTAIMLMQMVDAGTIRYSDPVDRYLQEIRQIQGLPASTTPVTFVQLATMSAGIPPEPREEGPFWNGPASAWETTLLSALPHVNYASSPGTHFMYSSLSYAILGAALERAAGVPYLDWQRLQILEPLGLTHTRFEVDSTIAGDLARGYTVARGGTVSDSESANALRAGIGYKMPSHAMFSTIDDLARFVSFELGNGPERVLPRARLDDAFGGLVAINATMQSGYGIGFMAFRVGDFYWMGYSGGIAGYNAAIFFDRASHIGVIALRSADGGKATTNIAATILKRLVRGPPTELPSTNR